ncbi:hypothetical protein Tco_0311498 [Tanacetum coccineum]
MQNPGDISNPTTALDIALEFMSKAFQLNNTTPTNNNQGSSSNPCYRHLVGQNAVQNQGIQNVRNQIGLSVVSEIANQHGNGNVVAARAEGNANRNNGNQLRCYNCQGEDHLACNCTVKPEKHDDQASTSGTQSDKAPVYDSDGSAEVHHSENCYDNDIFNMFTQEEQYTELLEPIPEPHQVQQNDSNVISEVSSVEQSGGTVDQHPATVEETHAYFESLYNNLAIEVEKVNTVNRKLRETNADLTTELARYKNQEKCFEISQEKYDKLERCIKLSKEKSTVSSLLEEKKRLKSDFKIREDELLDKQIQLENKIKELDNILVKMGQSIQTMHMLSPKPDLFYHTKQKMALGYQNPFYLKQAQQKQQSMYNGRVLLEKHDPPAVHDSKETLQLAQESPKSREELHFSNTSKTANVSKPNSIPNEDFSDDTTPSVAQKFLNEVKSTIVTLQRVVKQKMTLDIHNWSSNKFVRDFKSLAKEANESLAKHKALELEIERLLRAVVSQDIMSIVQNPSVVDSSNLQTELEPYNDMQQKIEWLQAQLGDQKGKSKDTPCVSNTLDPLSQKLENENVELEFQTQTKAIIDSLQDKSHDTIYENAKLRAQLFDKVSEQKDTTKGVIAQESLGLILLKLLGNGFSPNNVESTTRTRRQQPRNNPKSDKFVNGMKSRMKNQSANVSKSANQRKHKPRVWKPKKVGSKERFASPKPSTPRSCLRWSPTRRMFDLKGKIIATSESECQPDCSKGDNACTSNPQKPINKRFPSSTFSMTGCQNWLDTLLIPLLSEYKPKDKENHRDNECDS